jgi:hypothetical protein
VPKTGKHFQLCEQAHYRAKRNKSRQQNAAGQTTVLGTFKDSATILDVIQRSFLTNSATAATFTSV